MSHQEAYQVGDLLAFQANDPVFTGEQAFAQALAQAFAWSITHADTPYGVWNARHADMPYGFWATPDDGSELLVIVNNGEVFTKYRCCQSRIHKENHDEPETLCQPCLR